VNTSSFNGGGWIIVEKGLGFFLYFVQEIGKTANFPSLDYKEYSSHP
jgi:hypothetical protein